MKADNDLKAKLNILSIGTSESLEIAYKEMVNKMLTLGLKLAIAQIGYGGFNGFMIVFCGNNNWSCGIYVSYGNGFKFCRIEDGIYKPNTITVS